MPQFQYSPYRNESAGTIAELLARASDPQARAAQVIGQANARAAENIGAANARATEASGNAWASGIQNMTQALASIPGQLQQQKIEAQKQAVGAQQLEAGGLQLAEQKRVVALRTAFSKAIADTPMVDEGGISVYDVPAIVKNVPPEFQGNVDEIAKHVGGINDAFRQEQAARKAVVVAGATALIGGGSDPILTGHFLDTLEKNRTIAPEVATHLREFIAAHPDQIETVLRQFVPAQKAEILKEGDRGFDPATHREIPGMSVPAKPKTREVTTIGTDGKPQIRIVVDEPGQTFPVPAPKTSLESKNVLLDGKAAIVNFNPATGVHTLPSGEDVSSRVRPVPTSAQININNKNAPPAGDFDKTGKDFISTLPKAWQKTVEKIANYDEDPTKVASMRGAMRETLMQWVNQANPDYDQSQFTVRAPTRKAFTTGTQGQQITAMNTAIEHLDQLQAASDALDNGNFKPGNSAYNYLRDMFGSAMPSNFDTIKNMVDKEVEAVANKGVPTVSGTAEQKALAGKAASPAAISGYINTLIPLMGSKLNALHYQYTQAMGPNDPFKPLTPQAEAILAKRGAGTTPKAGADRTTPAPAAPVNPFRK